MANLKETINADLINAGVTHGKYLQSDIAVVIGNVILAILTIVGVIFIVSIVYAGFKWMLAKGEEQKITEARNLIVHSIIGLIIVVSAYAVSYFIVKALQNAV